jgi:hypothetical protein
VPTHDEFVEEVCTVGGRRDIKFGAATWMSSLSRYFLPIQATR